MLKSLDLMCRTFSQPAIRITFGDYIEVYKKYFNTTSAYIPYYKFFEKVFVLMTAFNKDYFRMGDWFFFLSQLLFGIRSAELKRMTCLPSKRYFEVSVHSAKGSIDRYLRFSLASPMIKLYANMHIARPMLIDYKPYYRALKRANPNFYYSIDCKHLSVTHLTRHFLCQCLKYVLRLKRVDISSFFGWFNQKTIDNYTDLTYWKALGGMNGYY